MGSINYNDVELTRKIVDAVQSAYANPYVEQIERLKYDNDSELYESGYNDAIKDVLKILKG